MAGSDAVTEKVLFRSVRRSYGFTTLDRDMQNRIALFYRSCSQSLPLLRRAVLLRPGEYLFIVKVHSGHDHHHAVLSSCRVRVQPLNWHRPDQNKRLQEFYPAFDSQFRIPLQRQL